MANDDEATMDEPGSTVPPVTGSDPPPWARDLMNTLRELPSKLNATLTDDHVNRIAEGVHGHFERSGAFTPVEAERETTKVEEEAEPTADEKPPKKTGKLSGFAAWFAGE
jgi:hypothetical protein